LWYFKPVERPESSVEQEFAAKRRKKTQKMKCVGVFLRAVRLRRDWSAYALRDSGVIVESESEECDEAKNCCKNIVDKKRYK
jgi:hypothetical protein